ncbi:hypothetical protein AGR7C_Lc10011 [Agrobacterium deltaense Zutra 3/1]|uniref:Uncharacterized protein n=1 Tax=Agrobacterium deltaense Zutra 3/1 TaxID=1183427 RepID=A0A1S7QMM1_9HYPH|nr:hypothetical protein AGR7C_Lc10011 [Agrobacterium deltaense Zutra 3/1]
MVFTSEREAVKTISDVLNSVGGQINLEGNQRAVLHWRCISIPADYGSDNRTPKMILLIVKSICGGGCENCGTPRKNDGRFHVHLAISVLLRLQVALSRNHNAWKCPA